MRLAFRVWQKPRIAWLGSWFLVFMAALYGCGYHDDHSSSHKTNQSVSQDTDTKSSNAQPGFLNTLDPAPLSQARRDSHLTDRLQTQTVLAFNNSVQYAHLKHLPYANPHAPKGGTLSMAAIGMFNSLNSFIDQGVPAAGTFYLYDTLMAGSLDEAFVLYPQLADKVSFDPNDRSWIIYHIHPDARFWDGSAVTAHDVQATYQAILSKGLMSWRAFLSGIEAIEVLDTHQVKFYFMPSAPTDLGATVGLMPVFARDDIIQNFDKISLTPLMGSGPYRLDRVEPSRRIRYIKDSSYWGQDIMVNQGRFNFDAIEYVYFADEAIAFEGFKSGVYRFRIENDIKRWATFEPNAAHGILKAAIPNDNPVR